MNRDRPPILTERRFDRRLAAMVLVAVLAHFLILGVLVFMGEFRLRPRAEGDAYTVEVVDGGELGGHLPAGLPDIDIGPAGRKQAGRAKAAPKTAPPKPPPPAKPEPPAPPEVAKAEPPKPEPRQEEPRPEPKPEPAKPEVVARADAEPDDGEKLIVPATPTPTPQAPRPTAPPTPRPTAPPTPHPTAPPPAPTPRATAAPTPRATPAPTKRPAATPTRAPAPRATPTATAIAKPAPTRTGGVAARPGATPSPRAGGPAPSPTAASREAQIADALARVQQRVGRGEEPGEHAPPGAQSAPTAPSAGNATGPASGPTGARGGGVGGTDAPDPSRRIGMGPGAGGAGKVRGLEFLLYYNQMIARIRGAWAWAGSKPDLIVKVRFRVQEDGSIADLRVTDSSGDSSYDASVLRAVRAVSPLAPPPAAYRNDFADVELTFQPSDLQAPG